MALVKAMGIETEYGIAIRHAADFDPVAASTLVVNSYKGRDPRRSASWNYDEESPLMDARGFICEPVNPDEEREAAPAVNDILTNGGRYYVDHAHPEYCTPECSNARDLVVYDKAGELILEMSCRLAEQMLEEPRELAIYKNNSDGKGHSYGCHENYLVDRKAPFQTIVDGVTAFLATRQIFAGAGKVGSENGAEPADFQIAQRSDFFETEVGLSTMVDRPIVNTRDEPHADEKLYRRFHVIVGDANMSEFATYLKAGSAALTLQMIEDGLIKDQIKLREPVAAMRAVSRDLSFERTYRMEDGREMTAIEIQRAYQRLAQQYVADRKAEDPHHEMNADIAAQWGEVLDLLESGWSRLDRRLDWAIKRSWLTAYRERYDLDWTNHRMRMLDLQYHDIRPRAGIFYRLQKAGRVDRMISQEEAIHAINNPPLDTRAYFRGSCLKRFPEAVHAASWNSLIFDTNERSLRMVPMLHPLRGTRTMVGKILQESATPAQLLERIESDDNP